MEGGGRPARQEAAGGKNRGAGEQEEEGARVAREERGAGWQRKTGLQGVQREGQRRGAGWQGSTDSNQWVVNNSKHYQISSVAGKMVPNMDVSRVQCSRALVNTIVVLVALQSNCKQE